MPQNLYQRIEKINFQQHEVLERITFYKDSMKLFLDYPIFGAGGGAWAASYEQYQNNPYTSRQAHNFFVQYMAEVGLVGILILLTMIFIIMYLFIKQHIRNSKQDYLPFYIITVSLLIHSMLDFDMSYVYIEALVFLSLGTMLASVHFSKNILSEKIVNWQKIYPGFLLLLSIIMIFISIKVLNADSYYKKANAQIAANEPFQQIMNSLDLAIKNRPAHPEFLLLKARMLNSAYNQTKDEKFFEQALNIIQELKKSEPYNKSVFELEYAMLTNKKDYIAVLSLLEQKLSIYPWDNTIYDRAITIAFELGAQAKQNNDLQSEKQYWNKSIKYYEEVLQRIKLLELLPEGQNQGRPFTVLPSMALSIGQIYFANQNYDKASEVLKTNIDASLETDISKAISRYYIASLMRQGKQDQTVYDKLLSVDPNEKTEIESLINSN
ncbi:hypothetical protein PN4B1_23020 [Paenibacillus naphthalenovorans]|nr:hypothetical protein PN4B1_23020 [Paenibacillus naphthalenovorans]